MSGDWIKMRADLQTHPKVVRIASALNADRLRVIGALHAAWCVFDAHTTDGQLESYPQGALDLLIGWPGFSQAMIDVGWLEVSEHSLCVPRFDEHNSQSAKRRCTESARKKASRAADKKRTSVQDDDGRVSALPEEKKRPREEREKSKTKEDSARISASTEDARAQGQTRVVPDQLDSDVPEPKFTPAGLICKAMRAVGMADVNPGDPRLLELIRQGAEEPEFVGLATEAVAKGKGFGWVLVALQHRRAEAAAIRLAAVVPTHINPEVDATQAYLTGLEAHRTEASAEDKAKVSEKLRLARERISSAALNAPPTAGIPPP